ncbi:hypothetical protein SRHO_G00213040 [Serrasalmus rhombeus]
MHVRLLLSGSISGWKHAYTRRIGLVWEDETGSDMPVEGAGVGPVFGLDPVPLTSVRNVPASSVPLNLKTLGDDAVGTRWPTASAPGPAGAPAPDGGNQAPPNLTSNRRLQQTQAQVDEVVDIMRVNVDKVLERDQKLSELDDRADALQAGASQFETSAAKLKNKYWWKNAKMMIILGVICVIVLIVIIVYFST